MTIQSSKIVWEALPVAPEMTTRSCDLNILMEYKTSSEDEDENKVEGSGINSTTELECLAQIIDVVVEEDDEAVG